MTDNEARAALAARCEGIGNRWGGPVGNETMPFASHRTCAEVREDDAREKILRGLGR